MFRDEKTLTHLHQGCLLQSSPLFPPPQKKKNNFNDKKQKEKWKEEVVVRLKKGGGELVRDILRKYWGIQ